MGLADISLLNNLRSSYSRLLLLPSLFFSPFFFSLLFFPSLFFLSVSISPFFLFPLLFLFLFPCALPENFAFKQSIRHPDDLAPYRSAARRLFLLQNASITVNSDAFFFPPAFFAEPELFAPRVPTRTRPNPSPPSRFSAAHGYGQLSFAWWP